jgi:integrase
MIAHRGEGEVLGLTESQVRHLLDEQRIARVRVGKRDLIPREAINRFIISNTVEPKPWRDETTAPSSASSEGAASTYICWKQNGRGGQRSTATADREQAEIVFADFLHQRNRAVGGPRDPAEALITDVLDDYAREHGPTTRSPWRIACAVEVLGRFWEARNVADITPQTCRGYAIQRERSDGTTRRELGVLAAAINHAHREGRLTRTVSVSLPPSAEPRDRWLTAHEAALLLRASLREPRVRLYLPLFILIGLRCGARKDAILGLRWPQVDFERRLISFKEPGAKTTNKRRADHVPIPSKLLGHLKRARARGTELGFVVHENGARLKDVKRGFASACRRAGLTDVTPHTLRHTCATWKAQARVPLWEAAGFLGMSRETLEKVYAHHDPDHLRAAAEAQPRRPPAVRRMPA